MAATRVMFKRETNAVGRNADNDILSETGGESFDKN